MKAEYPFSQELVLIGGGHTHALILRKWGMNPLPGARVTVINPGPSAPYTGMLPGFVAGHYAREDLAIDLVKLARFAGARLILGAATSINPNSNSIEVHGRPAIAFDVASINIGITSDLPDLPGFKDHAVAAKPLGPFAFAWVGFKAALAQGSTRGEIAVIGGGVGGCELALAMAFALDGKAKVTVIERQTALPGLSNRARKALLNRMASLNIALLEGAEPQDVTPNSVILADGTEVPSCFTVGAAGARPHDWLSRTGLDHQGGFLTVNEMLQTSAPMVFASGDCCALPDPRPKAGVFAVRQAPVLFDNLRGALAGRANLRPFRPQRDYLKLVSLGEKSALADKWGLRIAAPWVWRWKDQIDRKFMDQFRDLPKMVATALPRDHAAGLPEAIGPKPLCGGCGAKVGGNALGAALSGLVRAQNPQIESLPGDDAAILRTGRTCQVLTTDHLRAVTDDPWVMAQIAATHALGDIWAMGARPQTALATVILPRMADRLQAQYLNEIMAGAHAVFSEAGAEIVGGHSSVGSELTIGFSLTGQLDRPAITLAGARAGDRLILTKPLGIGTILAAEMAMQARGDWVAACLSAMTASQAKAATILSNAHAMTDVTGFGLAGHLANICRASGTGAGLDSAAVPIMPGALELAEQGVRSSLYPQNRAAVPELAIGEDARSSLLFDPQTSGGLLASVAPDQATAVLERLLTAGYPAAIIGQVTDQSGEIALE